MKKIITLIALLILSAGFAKAQDDDDAGMGGLKNEGIQVGALVGLRAGINTNDNIHGIKNRPVVASMPDISLIGSYLFDRKNGTRASLEICYGSYAYGFNYDPDNGQKVYKGVSCIEFIPQFNFGVLNLGLALGIPSSASFTTTTNGKAVDTDLKTDQMDTFIEGRVGFDVNVMSSTTGDMTFFGRVGYLFNSPFSTQTSKSENDHLVSLTLGVGYLFNIPQ